MTITHPSFQHSTLNDTSSWSAHTLTHCLSTWCFLWEIHILTYCIYLYTSWCFLLEIHILTYCLYLYTYCIYLYTSWCFLLEIRAAREAECGPLAKGHPLSGNLWPQIYSYTLSTKPWTYSYTMTLHTRYFTLSYLHITTTLILTTSRLSYPLAHIIWHLSLLLSHTRRITRPAVPA